MRVKNIKTKYENKHKQGLLNLKFISYNKIMEFMRKNKHILILTILGIVFFFIYSILPMAQLNWQKQNSAQEFVLKFNTPDETINYYFTSQFTETGDLYYFEPLDGFMRRVIFPRWALVLTTTITPGNFLGIDLIYGSLVKIFSPKSSGFVIPFLTPLFAVVGVLFFFLLLKEFFKKQIAFISSLLVFIFPGFWYYASRTMFHNIFFLSLLIIGLYFLIKLFKSQKHKLLFSILTGLFFGLSLITRTSEIVWIFLMVLIILIFYRKKVFDLKKINPSASHFKKSEGHLPLKRGRRLGLWPYLLISLIIFLACFVPVLYHNKILYNNYFSTGYNLNTMTENLEGGEVGKLNFIKALVLPFGFHPRVIASVIYNYILKLFWPWVLLYLIGLIVFLKQKNKKREHKLYAILLLVVSCWLLIVYGSWYFKDSITGIISLGSSYIRYFLPIFIFNIVLIGFLFFKIWQKKLVYKILLLVVSCCLLVVSSYQVLFKTQESLIPIKNQLIQYQIQSQDILKYTHEDDIILMDSGTDKILFPLRKHLIVPQNGVEWVEIKKILPYRNVYYFHHTQNVSEQDLNSEKFYPQNLEVHDEVLIDGGGLLFRLSSRGGYDERSR